MKARYNKGLEHCIEIYDSNGAMALKVADAKALVESMNKAIEEAERDYEREQLTEFEMTLDDIIREATATGYNKEMFGDRMVDISQWAKRLIRCDKGDVKGYQIPGSAVENIEFAIDLLDKKHYGAMANSLRETLTYVKEKNWRCNKPTLDVFEKILPGLEGVLNKTDYARMAILFNDLKKM